VSAMGQNREAGAVTALLSLLRAAASGENDLPVRSIKTALVRHPMRDLQHFLPFLQDGNARVRFLVADSIREICSQQHDWAITCTDFPPDLYRWFLHNGTRDNSQDVRARSAAVIGYFRDPNATEALRALLRDESEFVRLHAVRACRHKYYSGLVPDIVERITDPRWRVREAAVATIAVFDHSGRQELAKSFLATADRYASEQIAEELQRSGTILQMLSALGSRGEERRSVMDVCIKMARLSKGSLLAEHLREETDPAIGSLLLEALLTHPTDQLLDCLRAVAGTQVHPLRAKALALLQGGLVKPAGAGAEGD
jgi:hypothetical protein